MHRAIFILLGIIMLAILFVSGCTETVQTPGSQKVYTKDDAFAACKELCEASKDAGVDLSEGPCLSDQIVKDWVCDIAHDPRQPTDNDPENQCQAFIKQEAHSFIELDENCELIQFYERK